MKTNYKDLHTFQKDILKKLALNKDAKFNDLLIPNIESEHMNYHLKKLIDDNLVEKLKEKYKLTDFGKDFINSMDDAIDYIEKQPKTSILMNAVRKNSKGETEYLLMKRLKQPYFGKVMELSGKVQYGESIVSAVERELYEETGLKAGFIQLKRIYHRLRFNEKNEFVQDVIFYIFFMKDFSGNFIEKLPWQENFWMTKDELYSKPDIETIEGLKLDDNFNPNKIEFSESIKKSDGF